MLSAIIDSLNQPTNSSKTSKENFYAQNTMHVKDLVINISEFGELKFPLSSDDINKLIELSSPAKFGLRENTLLDKNVRDTYEISADKITIQQNENKFAFMLEEMAKTLDLSPNAKLKAHLHNMLIYSPGQFFKPHQDSEKLNNMIASLVVVLPSPHIGGSLLIEHNKETHHFVSEHLATEGLQCLAFYADCKHEIKKVKQGYRIALTYNLVLESGTLEIEEPSNKALAQSLKEYFYPPENDLQENDGLQKLVYLFEHSYTEHSLKWLSLKGNDGINALAFRAAAKQLDLIPHIALVEIHQSWTAMDEDEVDELIDDSTTFSDWFDENGIKLPYGNLSVTEDEMCSTTELDDLEPSEKEYEGYVGNYGNTMDYWYRRSALVLWRKSDQIPMNFELNYNAAIANLLELTKEAGNESQVSNTLKRSLKYIRNRLNEDKQSYLNTLTTLACYVNNTQLAELILELFPFSAIKPHSIEEIAKLHDTYGADWCLKLFTKWKTDYNERHRYAGEPKFEDIGNIINNLVKYNCDNKIAQFLLQLQTSYIMENDKKEKQYGDVKPSTKKQETIERINAIKSLIDGCIAIKDANSHHKFISYIISNRILYPEFYLGEILLHIQTSSSIAQSNSYGYETLRNYVVKSLTQELTQGLRAKDDWSIEIKLSCSCERCKIATNFLRSQETTKIWPIVMSDREHIIEIFKRLELPVDLSVEKKGSPHKLIMSKNSHLYLNAFERFNAAQNYYDKIAKNSEPAKNLNL